MYHLQDSVNRNLKARSSLGPPKKEADIRAVRAVETLSKGVNPRKIHNSWKPPIAEFLGKYRLFLERPPEWGSGGRWFESSRPDIASLAVTTSCSEVFLWRSRPDWRKAGNRAGYHNQATVVCRSTAAASFARSSVGHKCITSALTAPRAAPPPLREVYSGE